MKKLLLITFLLLAMAGISVAQVIENFEPIKMNLMLGGSNDSSTMTVVLNPDTLNNHTAYCTKFVRSKNGVPWGGFYATLKTPVDVTVNKFVHVKVWKPRISPTKFKLEGGASGDLEIFSMYPQTLVNQWEDMVFDFRSKTGTYPKIVFPCDFLDPVGLTEDIVIYFDEIMVNNDSVPMTAPVTMMENYENIPLNYMLGGSTDSSSMVKVPNPDPNGINISSYVIKFVRSKNGVPWGGFWSTTPVDVTTNKYMHVKIWKPRISPIKFKIQDGAAGTLEKASTNPQTSTGVWEDMVFDFSTKTGPYPIIAFMPDFEDPLTLTEDITIYFDDIILNNNPNPIVVPVQKLNVDMKGAHLGAGQDVYVAGDFGGINGTWAEPGTNANNLMTDPDGDSIYSLNLNLASAIYKIKFFKGTGWGGGETISADRTLTVTGDFNNTYKFGKSPANVSIKVNMKGSGLAGESIYCTGNFGGVYGSWNEPGTNANCAMTAEAPVADSIYAIFMVLDSIGSYQFKFFKGAGWNGGEWTGDPNRMVKILHDTAFAVFKWGQKYPEGISEVSLAGKIQTYPNPVKDMLNVITSTELSQVVITNMVGQSVYRLDNIGLGRKAINVSDFSNGVYFITFYGKSGGQLTQKILKY